MLKYVAARSLHSLILLVVAVAVVFVMVRVLPGDPVTAMTGDYPVPPAYAAQIRQAYGLDRPLPQQLVIYLAAVARGDLGFSFKNQKVVSQLLLERGVNTLLLGGAAFLLATLGGTAAGTMAAARRSSLLDGIVRFFAAVSYAAPAFWVGQLLILLLAVHFSLLPVAGMTATRGAPQGFGYVLDVIRHLILPALVLALPSAAIHIRVVRVAMIESLAADYVKTARAKGLAQRVVMLRHVLRNALLPLITVAGLELPLFLTGAVLVETVFSWPGLGRLLFDSISSRDYPVIEAMLLVVTISVISANWIADLLYRWLDPRIAEA